MSIYAADAFDEFYKSLSGFNERLMEHLKLFVHSEPDRILDMACGSGISTRAISKSFNTSAVIGADISSDLIRSASSTFVPINVEYILFDEIDSLLEVEKFDLIVVKSAYHLIQKDGVDIYKLQKLLRKGGGICILEKTYTCIESYRLMESAEKHWHQQTDWKKRNALVHEFLESNRHIVATSRYGEEVKFPKSKFINGIKNRQISCLWDVSDLEISSWINKKNDNCEYVCIFEDYDIVLIRPK